MNRGPDKEAVTLFQSNLTETNETIITHDTVAKLIWKFPKAGSVSD